MSQGRQSLDPAILTCLSLLLPRQGHHTHSERKEAEGGQEELKEAFAHLQDPKKVTVAVKSEHCSFKLVFYIQCPAWPDLPSLAFLTEQLKSKQMVHLQKIYSIS